MDGSLCEGKDETYGEGVCLLCSSYCLPWRDVLPEISGILRRVDVCARSFLPQHCALYCEQILVQKQVGSTESVVFNWVHFVFFIPFICSSHFPISFRD